MRDILYRVKSSYADDSSQEIDSVLTFGEIKEKYPFVPKLVTEPDLIDGLFSLGLTSGLWRLEIKPEYHI
jgi:hypothetical protein